MPGNHHRHSLRNAGSYHVPHGRSSEIVRDKGPKDEGRDERFGRWIKAIRDLAKRHSLHAIVLCQVNVQGDLAESRKMGHLADHHFYFHRKGRQHFLECKKNRFGPKYTYAIEYDRNTQRMREQGIVKKKKQAPDDEDE